MGRGEGSLKGNAVAGRQVGSKRHHGRSDGSEEADVTKERGYDVQRAAPIPPGPPFP
jgi:hypothetical protein